MSINSSLVKLADKIDVNGKSTISPEYKNPNNSIEKSIERIADNYSGSGGGGTGGGVLVVNVDGQTMTLDKTYNEIKNAPFAVLKMTVMEGLIQWNTPYMFDDGVGVVGKYRVYVFVIENGSFVSYTFTANNADGYPVLDMG